MTVHSERRPCCRETESLKLHFLWRPAEGAVVKLSPLLFGLFLLNDGRLGRRRLPHPLLFLLLPPHLQQLQLQDRQTHGQL